MHVVCDKCSLGLKVIGKPDDFRILEAPQSRLGGFSCPSPSCGGLLRTGGTQSVSYIEISVPAFYRAIHGMGFGKSAEAGADKVLELLKGQRVIGADLQEIGNPKRSIIKSVTLEDGTTLYLASSNEGACVYLIEEGNNVYEGRSMASVGNLEGGPSDGA